MNRGCKHWIGNIISARGRNQSPLGTIFPFFILYCLLSLLRILSLARSCRLASLSVGVKSGVM